MGRFGKNRERNRRAARWLLGLSLAAMVFFAVRLAADMVYWNDPRHHDQQLEPWMTVGYVARSWDIDRRSLREALELGPAPDHKSSLGQLAHSRNMEFDAYAEDVMQTILQEKAVAE